MPPQAAGCHHAGVGFNSRLYEQGRGAASSCHWVPIVCVLGLDSSAQAT
jgi:hypothetical protein